MRHWVKPCHSFSNYLGRKKELSYRISLLTNNTVFFHTPTPIIISLKWNTRCWPDAVWFQFCSFACLENLKQRLTEPLMRKLIKKPSEMGKQITCTTQSPLSSSFPSPPPKVRNDKAEWVIGSKQSAEAEWVCLYLVALMPFILLHCRTKMLPKQQEGLVHVMMALVKPLIVCIWVELELVIGDHTLSDFRASL